MNIQSSSPSERHRRGFTLVELMMVVGLMLLVLKLMLPSLKGLMGGTVGSAARNQLIGSLNSARTMALQNGSPVYVVFMPPLYDDPQKDPPPLLSDEEFQVSGDVPGYLKGKGNSMLAEQSISYAIYAEYLPGNQPGDPAKKWLTDWKRLPAGFYFTKKDLDAIRDQNLADASGGATLTFNNLKNGHSRSNMISGGWVERKMCLPYLTYNSRGEMAEAELMPNGVREWILTLTEGGVLPPRKVDGKYSHKAEHQDDPSVAANSKKVSLSINGITGLARAREEDQ